MTSPRRSIILFNLPATLVTELLQIWSPTNLGPQLPWLEPISILPNKPLLPPSLIRRRNSIKTLLFHNIIILRNAKSKGVLPWHLFRISRRLWISNRISIVQSKENRWRGAPVRRGRISLTWLSRRELLRRRGEGCLVPQGEVSLELGLLLPLPVKWNRTYSESQLVETT